MASGDEPARRERLRALNEPLGRADVARRQRERVVDHFAREFRVAERVFAFEPDERQLAIAGQRRRRELVRREIGAVRERHAEAKPGRRREAGAGFEHRRRARIGSGAGDERCGPATSW